MDIQQKAIQHLVYPLNLWRTNNLPRLKYIREYERTQFLSRAEIEQLQLERFQRLFEYAYDSCDFYKQRFAQMGIVPSDIRSLSDIHQLPILEKRDIQQNNDGMISNKWPKNDLIRNQTGGSTGTPISFYLSHERDCSRAAATIRHNRWAQWNIGDKTALLWGAARDFVEDSWKQRVRNSIRDRSLSLNTAHLTEEKLQKFHVAIKKFRPKVFLAYAKSAVLFAQYLKSNGLDAYQPKSIVTSAEVLSAEDRKLLEEVFGCKVYNRYGCREVSVVASECSEHSGLHTMAEGLLVEVVGTDGAPVKGKAGSVVVTDLLNFAMPMIRYRIGDMAVASEEECKCGRGLPMLKSLQGRITDFLVGADGRLVSGVYLTTYVIAERPRLGRVQLWQEEAGRVLCKISPESRDNLDTDLNYLVTETERFLGPGTKVEIEFVDNLQEEESGKYLFCRSTAACDFMQTQGA